MKSSEIIVKNPLPNIENAKIDLRKLTDYALNPENDLGEWKEGGVYLPNWHGKYAVLSLLSYDNVDKINDTKVFITYNAFKECLPEPNKIFPFAIDGAGNIFLFDYRKDENEPSILFLDHEMAITEEDLTEEELEEKPLVEWLEDNFYYVSSSFNELINSIHPLE